MQQLLMSRCLYQGFEYAFQKLNVQLEGLDRAIIKSGFNYIVIITVNSTSLEIVARY